jgi:ribosomal 30S subunit maturation factor RimM
MVPAIKDVVRAVDMKERRITLRLLDGLKELKA